MNNHKKTIVVACCIVFSIISFIISLAFMNDVEKNVHLVRSSLLRIVSSKTENTERYDYVDEKGNITFADDKCYATLIRTKQKNSVLEEYYDAEGRPAKQKIGYYAIKREYDDDNNSMIIYLDESGKPINTSAGYAVVKRTRSADGYEEIEEYYDSNGNHISTYSLCSGCKRIYDEEGRITDVIYIDESGMPSKTGVGYARIHKTYYLEGEMKGKVKEEFYYDEFDKPVKLINGQYGIHIEYDEFGRSFLITYLGKYGEPIISTDGYATKKRTYNNDDSLRTEMYFDQDNKPIALSEGQYGIYYVDDKKTYLDINGNIKFNLKNHLYKNPWLIIIMGMTLAIISVVSNKTLNYILFYAYLAFVVYMTLLFRQRSEANADFRIFWSYRQFFSNENLRWEILQNIILFIPLGFFLYGITKKTKWIFVIASLSLVIEAIQYFAGTGFSELDDVISNSLGGVIGYLIGKLTERLKQRINSWKCIQID